MAGTRCTAHSVLYGIRNQIQCNKKILFHILCRFAKKSPKNWSMTRSFLILVTFHETHA